MVTGEVHASAGAGRMNSSTARGHSTMHAGRSSLYPHLPALNQLADFHTSWGVTHMAGVGAAVSSHASWGGSLVREWCAV